MGCSLAKKQYSTKTMALGAWVAVYFCTNPWFLDASETKSRLQIVSEVYKKQPYIQVPSAWIVPTLRLQLVKNIQDILASDWQAQEVPVKDDKDDLASKLKCHPAVNVAIFSLKPQKTQLGLLLLYPQNYRELIEDPFAENPPPIVYLGTTQRVAFYYYPKHRLHKEVVAKLLGGLKLKK